MICKLVFSGELVSGSGRFSVGWLFRLNGWISDDIVIIDMLLWVCCSVIGSVGSVGSISMFVCLSVVLICVVKCVCMVLVFVSVVGVVVVVMCSCVLRLVLSCFVLIRWLNVCDVFVLIMVSLVVNEVGILLSMIVCVCRFDV